MESTPTPSNLSESLELAYKALSQFGVESEWGKTNFEIVEVEIGVGYESEERIYVRIDWN